MTYCSEDTASARAAKSSWKKKYIEQGMSEEDADIKAKGYVVAHQIKGYEMYLDELDEYNEKKNEIKCEPMKDLTVPSIEKKLVEVINLTEPSPKLVEALVKLLQLRKGFGNDIPVFDLKNMISDKNILA